MDGTIRETEIIPRFTRAELKAFGARLSQHREQLGWRQRELSRRTDIRTTRLSSIERGKAEPRLSELVRLRSALGLRLDEMVFGSPADTEPQELLEGVLAVARPDERQAIVVVLRSFMVSARQSRHAGGQP